MIKLSTLVFIVLFTTSCSTLDLLKTAVGAGGGPSLEVDTTVGDKEESVVGQVGSSTEISAESLTGGINTTNIEQVPPWVLLLLVLGWLMPSHTEIYREIKSWFKR